MRLDAVLLDMGGVLLDMEGSNGLPTGVLDFRGRQVMLRLSAGKRRPTSDDLERLVFDPWRNEYRERYRRGREAEMSPHLEALREFCGTTASAGELLSGWFAPYAESLRPIPDALPAVESLRRQGFAIALISNIPLPGALYRQVLDREGFARHIDTFRFSSDTGHRKPSPYMVRSALSELGVTASAAVMVGDRKASDVAAGRAAGTGTIWIESDYTDGPEPDWTVPSIAQLPDLLDRLVS